MMVVRKLNMLCYATNGMLANEAYEADNYTKSL